MNREEVRDEILSVPNHNLLLELTTGFGKSKLALDIMAQRVKPGSKVLIVVPRLVLMENWAKEISKWGYDEYLIAVEFVTYMSFPKKADRYDVVIFDECHHLSERCLEALESYSIDYSILLSATVKREHRRALQCSFNQLYCKKVSAREAIDEEVLPDPRVYLIPLTLDNRYATEEIIKNPKAKESVTISYRERWAYKNEKRVKVIIKCTEREYYEDMSSMIAWYKRKIFIPTFKNLFLRASGNRLNWLSNKKTSYVKALLDLLDKERTLTFCNGIEHTQELGKYCINSKNKQSEEYLEGFNEGRIHHITACNMLNEGMNLVDCRVGIYGTLNSSDTLIKQKLGRLLRHKEPIIVIPYYKDTRDEEIVETMVKDYNPELVTTISNLTELKL